ncbi:MAG: DUF2177 family protein [Desulfobacterales bacterium]|nr:DUF2177 family protein [Desulfobacterales bacterium]
MMLIVPLYAIMLAIFLALDLAWLGGVARGFYTRHLDRFFSDKVKWPAAFVFYAIFVAGLLVFAVDPALDRASLARAAVFGSLYGLCTYATYDLTNLATLKEWPLAIVVVDMVWGVSLSGTVAAAGYIAATRLL